MMKTAYFMFGSVVFLTVFAMGVAFERYYGVAVRTQAAAIDACAREHWVYPEGCEMQAVVVKGRELLPIPEGMGAR